MGKTNVGREPGLVKRTPERPWEYIVHVPGRIRALVNGRVERPWTAKAVVVHGQANIVVGLGTHDEVLAKRHYDIVHPFVQTLIKRAEEQWAALYGRACSRSMPPLKDKASAATSPDPSSLDQGKNGGLAAPRDALHEIAEELGRSAARRFHAHRRGYSLVEGMAGILIMACVILLLYWVWR